MNKIFEREMILPLLMVAGVLAWAPASFAEAEKDHDGHGAKHAKTEKHLTDDSDEHEGKKGRCKALEKIEKHNKGKGAEVSMKRVGCADPSAPGSGGSGGTGSATIGPEGGSFTSQDGMAEIVVPPGALAEPVLITATPVAYPAGETLEFATAAYDFQPDGQTFAVPVRLTLHYDPARLPSGVSENLMNVYFHHPDTGKWEGTYAAVDTAADTVTASVSHFTTFTGAPDKHILIFAISNRADSTAFGTAWYRDPSDFNTVLSVLASAGFNRVDAMDQVSLPTMDATTLSRYKQVWFLEADGDRILDITPGERDLVLQFESLGRGVWISGENNMNQPFLTFNPPESNLSWFEDADYLMEGFGVDDPGDLIFSYDLIYSYAAHPLFAGIDWISFNGEVGRLINSNPSVQPLLTYENRFGGVDAPAGTYLGAAVLDERDIGRGRVIFDAGWVLGYTYTRIHPSDDNLLFVVNVANFLAN